MKKPTYHTKLQPNRKAKIACTSRGREGKLQILRHDTKRREPYGYVHFPGGIVSAPGGKSSKSTIMEVGHEKAKTS